MRTKLILGIILFQFATISCNEDVLNLKDPQNITTDSFFGTYAELVQSTTGAYASLYFRGLYSHEGFQSWDALGNEIGVGPGGSNEATVLSIYNYSYTNDNPIIQEMWKSYYRVILRSNLTLDKVAKFKVNNPTSKDNVDRLVGEVSFLRAWAYFQLAHYWGRVPLHLNYDSHLLTPNLPRSKTVGEVWDVVESDLKKAIDLLPVSYQNNDVGRVTKGAAIALLGKKHIYNKEWALADSEFAKIGDGQLGNSLLPFSQYMNNFGEDPATENNAESLFEVQFQWRDVNFPWGGFTDDGNETTNNPTVHNVRPQLYGFRDWSNWKFSAQLVDDFTYPDESGVLVTDARAAMTFYGSKTIGDTTWCDNCTTGAKLRKYDYATLGYWYKKYNNYERKEGENTLQSGNNERMIRFSDVLLMWAEAKLKLGDNTGAITLINKVRNRAGMFSYTKSYNASELFDLLRRERVLELVGEHLRFNDLVRWGIAKEVLSAELVERGSTSTFDDKYLLFPIPLQERNTNPLIANDVAQDWN